jgi:hypothetical protein
MIMSQPSLFPLYEAAQATETILKRSPGGEVSLSPSLKAGIERVFGEVLSPLEAVQRIWSMCDSAVIRLRLTGLKRLAAFA